MTDSAQPAAAVPQPAEPLTKSQWGKPQDPEQVLKFMHSPDLGQFAGAWSLAAQEGDVDSRVEETAQTVLRTFDPFNDAHLPYIQVVLAALHHKELPLQLGTLKEVGRFVSGKSDPVRMLAIGLLQKQYPLTPEKIRAAGLEGKEQEHRGIAWQYVASGLCDGAIPVLECAIEAALQISPEPQVLVYLLKCVHERALAGHYGHRSREAWALAARCAPAAASLPQAYAMEPHQAVARGIALFGFTSTDPLIKASSEQGVSRWNPPAAA